MRINYNVSAMISNNALSNNNRLLSQSLERLSSGLKVNRAKDNPAGLAMAKRMNAQLKGLAVANQNASDGISVIETADGALTEVAEMLQRMNELSVKAANGPLSDGDRKTIQDEIIQLKEEITRVSDTTEFNGQPLLNGEFAYKGFTNNNDVKVNSYSKDVAAKIYSISSIQINRVMKPDPDDPTKQIFDYYDINVTYPTTPTNTSGFDHPNDMKYSVRDDLFFIKDENGFEMSLDLSAVGLPDNNVNVTGLQIDVTGIGAMRLQIGANEGQVLETEIPAVTLQNMGIENIDVSTKEGALDAIDRLDGAIKYVADVRGRLGAYQNRLESTVCSLDVTSENMTAAYSRIMDVDMAEEMTQYTTAQVLTQAGTSMLAQANERPSQVLQLLQ